MSCQVLGLEDAADEHLLTDPGTAYRKIAKEFSFLIVHSVYGEPGKA